TDPVMIGLQKTPLFATAPVTECSQPVLAKPLPTGGTAGVTFTTTPAGPLPQAGKEGVDFAVQLHALRRENRLAEQASCPAAGPTCLEVRGGWVDEDFKAGMKTVTIKAMSEAYFRMLERHPEMKDVFRLGNCLAWITPSGTALVIDPSQGKEKLSDERIDALF